MSDEENIVEPEIVSVPERHGGETYTPPQHALVITTVAEEAPRPEGEVEPEVVSAPPPNARSTGEQPAPKANWLVKTLMIVRYAIIGIMTAAAAFFFFWVFLALVIIGLIVAIPFMLFGRKGGVTVKRFYVRK